MAVEWTDAFIVRSDANCDEHHHQPPYIMDKCTRRRGESVEFHANQILISEMHSVLW